MIYLHATCVAIGENALLLRGPSGAGKSDLALRLMHEGAALVADDQVALHADGGRLFASPPEKLVGLLEVRGVGILHTEFTPQAEVRLVVDLVERDKVERLPEPQECTIEGVPVPCLALCAFDVSTVAKLHAVLECCLSGKAEEGLSRCA